jgi:hypothetical protein
MIPDDWCKGIIKPLHKSGSIYDLDNYRGKKGRGQNAALF